MGCCPRLVASLPIFLAVHCFTVPNAAGKEVQEDPDSRTSVENASEQRRADVSVQLVTQVIRTSLSTRGIEEEAIEEVVGEFHSSVGERKLGFIYYSAPTSTQQGGENTCCRFEGDGSASIRKMRAKVDVAPVSLELGIREGEHNKVLRSRCMPPESCADDLLEVQQEVHAEVRGTIVVAGDPVRVDGRLSLILTFGFRCELRDGDAKERELSRARAPEPAVGPDSDGTSSPPAR